MSVLLEKSTEDLKDAWLVINKLGDTFDAFQVHYRSILNLAERWKNIESSFSVLDDLIVNKVKELEEKGVENAKNSSKLEHLFKKVEARQKRLDLGESELSERVRKVQMREKDLKECYKVLDGRLKGVELMESRINALDEKEAEVDKRCKEVELETVRVKVLSEELERREREIERCREEVESEKVRVRDLSEELKAKKEVLETVRFVSEELERSEREIEWCHEEVEFEKVKVRDLNKELERREREIERCRKEVESEKVRVRDLSEELKAKEVELETVRVNVVSEELERREREIERRREEMESEKVRVRDLSEELEVKEDELNERVREVELKEDEMRMRCGTLEMKEERWRVKEKEMDEVYEALELREKEMIEELKLLASREKLLEANKKEVMKHSEALELKEKDLDELGKVLEAREKEVKMRSKGIVLKEKDVNDRCKALELKEKEVNTVCEKVELKAKQLKELWEVLEFNEKEVSEREKVLELEEKRMNDSFHVLESKEKKIDELHTAMELGESEFGEPFLAREVTVKKLDKPFNVFQRCHGMGSGNGLLKEKVANDVCEAEFLKEKQFDVSCEAMESKPTQSTDNDKSSMKVISAIHYLCINMDADGVKSYLLENSERQNMLKEKISDALSCASDPAKLVLDVCRSFQETNSAECVIDASKTCCIFFLELFTNLSSPITPIVKDDARDFAVIWKSRLKFDQSDTFAFLLFIAAYNLASVFSTCSLIRHFNTLIAGPELYRPEESVYLARSLGLAEKIPGHVGSLIGRQRWLAAVKFVCVFKLQSSFPPVPLLEAYVEQIKKQWELRVSVGTVEEKIACNQKEMLFLSGVVDCISNFKLESEYPSGPFRLRIKELESLNAASALSRKRVIDSSPSVEPLEHIAKRRKVETSCSGNTDVALQNSE